MLLIDAGNTCIKSAVVNGESITTLAGVETTSILPPSDWQSLPVPTRVAISNVAGPAVAHKLADWVNAAWSIDPTFVQVRELAAGVRTAYEDISKLGVDRWLAAVAGFREARGAVVVVDAGTAVTIDIVDATGVHLGGAIAPGLSLMVNSLTGNTADLHLDALQPSIRIPTHTQTAISMGCIDAFAGGIERLGRRVTALIDVEPHWIITGGDAERAMSLCEIQFQHVPALVLQGLRLALEDQT